MGIPSEDNEPKTDDAAAAAPEQAPGSEQFQGAQQSQADGQPAPDHGATGEGSGSAMARLISQEQARLLPAAGPAADPS